MDIDSADFNPFELGFDEPAGLRGNPPNGHDEAPSKRVVKVKEPSILRPTRETYDELQDAYEFFNQALFDGELPYCLITLQRERHTLGYFHDTTFVRRTGETTDEIAMNPRYFATRSIRETLSTLVHEMVHLWQFHFGGKGRKGYHNKGWGDRMERLGLMPSNTGQPGGKKVGEKMTHYIIAGGPFDLACTELITEDFNLSWMDRNPMVRPELPIPPEEAAAAGMLLPTPEEVAEVEAAEKHVDMPATEAKRQRTDASNRVKYRCPSCATQVWGKPDLLINCGIVKCGGAKFETLSPAAATPVYAPTPRPF